MVATLVVFIHHRVNNQRTADLREENCMVDVEKGIVTANSTHF